MTKIISSTWKNEVTVKSLQEAESLKKMLGKYGIQVEVGSKIRLEG
jgi:hypothetical protein